MATLQSICPKCGRIVYSRTTSGTYHSYRKADKRSCSCSSNKPDMDILKEVGSGSSR